MNAITNISALKNVYLKIDNIEFKVSSIEIALPLNKAPSAIINVGVDTTRFEGYTKVVPAALSFFNTWYTGLSDKRFTSASVYLRFESETGDMNFDVSDWVLEGAGGVVDSRGTLSGVVKIYHPIYASNISVTEIGSINKILDKTVPSGTTIFDCMATAISEFVDIGNRDFYSIDDSEVAGVIASKTRDALQVLLQTVDYDALSTSITYNKESLRSYVTQNFKYSPYEFFTGPFLTLFGLSLVPKSIAGNNQKLKLEPYAPWKEENKVYINADQISKLVFPPSESKRSISGASTYSGTATRADNMSYYNPGAETFRSGESTYFIPNELRTKMDGPVLSTSVPHWLKTVYTKTAQNKNNGDIKTQANVSIGSLASSENRGRPQAEPENIKKWLKHFFFANYRSSYRFNPRTCLLLSNDYLPGKIVALKDEDGSEFVSGFCNLVVHRINLDAQEASTEFVITHARAPGHWAIGNKNPLY